MSRFDTYRDSFPNARLTRSKTGVLEVALHTNGGTLAFNGYTHEQFVDLFHAIGSDRDNRVVILTGSGNAFMETISPEGFDFFSPQGSGLPHYRTTGLGIAGLPPVAASGARRGCATRMRSCAASTKPSATRLRPGERAGSDLPARCGRRPRCRPRTSAASLPRT